MHKLLPVILEMHPSSASYFLLINMLTTANPEIIIPLKSRINVIINIINLIKVVFIKCALTPYSNLRAGIKVYIFD